MIMYFSPFISFHVVGEFNGGQGPKESLFRGLIVVLLMRPLQSTIINRGVNT